MNTIIICLVLAAAIIGIGMFMLAFMYPEYYARFGKFLFRTIKHALGQPTFTPQQEEARAKTKKLTPYMTLASRIEQLIPGQTLRFKIPDTWGGSFIAVELNPQYNEGGRKYILSIENAVNGMPGDKRTIMYVTDKPIEIAASIMDRNGELFVAAGEKPVSTEKVAVGVRKEATDAEKAGAVS